MIIAAVHTRAAAAAAPTCADLWVDLRAELDVWRAADTVATFWWRDDDATMPTPALDRLLRISGTRAVPVALAVIPEPATPALAEALAGHAGVGVLQHGWAHANHAPVDARKCELGDHRPAAVVLDDLRRGRARMAAIFGDDTPAILVPPWNRIGRAVIEGLPRLGLTGLSTWGPRGVPQRGLAEANTHVDPIDWAASRRFAGTEPALRRAIAHLRARRAGAADPDEPTGLLTHHLVMDDDTWSFVERFLAETTAHAAARWLNATAALATARSSAREMPA